MIDLNLPDLSCTGEQQPQPRHRPHTRRPQRSLQSVAPRAVSLCQSVVRSVLNRGNFLRCGNQRTQFGYSSDITRLYSWQSLTRFNHTRIQAGNIGTSASFQGLMKRTITCCLQDPTITRIERQIFCSARKKAGAYSHYLFLALPLRPLFGLYLYLRATSLHSPLVYKHNLHNVSHVHMTTIKHLGYCSACSSRSLAASDVQS